VFWQQQCGGCLARLGCGGLAGLLELVDRPRARANFCRTLLRLSFSPTLSPRTHPVRPSRDRQIEEPAPSPQPSSGPFAVLPRPPVAVAPVKAVTSIVVPRVPRHLVSSSPPPTISPQLRDHRLRAAPPPIFTSQRICYWKFPKGGQLFPARHACRLSNRLLPLSAPKNPPSSASA
jgi:hypothetical protein